MQSALTLARGERAAKLERTEHVPERVEAHVLPRALQYGDHKRDHVLEVTLGSRVKGLGFGLKGVIFVCSGAAAAI